MNSTVKTIVFWVVMAAAVVLLYLVVKTGAPSPETEIKFSEFMNLVEQGAVAEVTLAGTN